MYIKMPFGDLKPSFKNAFHPTTKIEMIYD